MGETKRALFLCNGNSGRSQMAEALMRHVGGSRFEAFSAGARPAPAVHPQAVETLLRNRVPVDGLEPKDITSFAGQPFDFVIGLCDRAKEEPPVMPGADMIYWTFPDPADGDVVKQARAFEDTFRGLERRIRLLMAVYSRRPEPASRPASLHA